MPNYATLRELEETASQFPESLSGDDMAVIATKVGKPMRSIEDLDVIVSDATNNYTCSFKLQNVPRLWHCLIGLYMPSENVSAWLNDRNAFDGSSPLEKLSVV